MIGGVLTDLESSFEARSPVSLADPDNSMPMDAQASEEEEQSDSDIAYEEDELSEKVEAAKPKYAVHTGLYEALPADVRLEVYKAAFPEMNRTYEKFQPWNVVYYKQIAIQYRLPCWNKYEYLQSSGFCSCPACESRRDRADQLSKAMTSNFARDPAIRTEFLTHYLSLVQFEWYRPRCETHATFIETLPGFFNLILFAGLIPAFKHLSLNHPWRMRRLRKGATIDISNEGLKTDALALGRIFAILHAYKINAVLTMTGISRFRTPFFDRIVTLCNMHLQRRTYSDGTPSIGWCTVGGEGTTEYEKLFTEDEELRKCAQDCKSASRR